MDAARWERIQSLFHRAADLPAAERSAWLEAECRDDPDLARDVLALLEEDARPSELLDGGLAHVADRMLGGADAPGIPPHEFGPYRLGPVLGEGGMGVVYLARREDLGVEVAIKILRDAWLSPARRERFAAEQRTLAQLNHPSIARLYDADTLSDGTPWFAMEYAQGVPLTTYCQERRSSVRERLVLFHAVCEAVQHAHLHAIIHRDLKPSNVVVKDDGAVKLLDFGIAKQLESVDMGADQTRTGLRLMTPAYAAPEQIAGGRVGVHTDVYALGVILYELLAGQLPFDLSDRTPSEAAAIVLEQQATRPSTLARERVARMGADAGVPAVGRAAWPDLDVLCLTAMHKDPDRRYRTVDALMRDIDHYLAGEPLDARPDTVGYRLGKFVRRNRQPVAAAAIALVVMVALVAFYTLRLGAARDAAVAETARTARIQQFMTNLFQGGDESVSPADSLRVVTLVERGVLEARALDQEPEVQADLYLTLGEIYEQLGRFAEADTLLRAAHDRRRSLLGADHPDVGESLVALGELRDAQGEYEEAEALVRDGLAMTRRSLPSDHPAVARATAVLGRVLQDRGEYDESIVTLEEAVRLQSVPDAAPADLAASLTELANSHFYAGNYDVSDSLNRRVLEIDRATYGERHPHVGDDLINLGAIQFERGRYAEAEGFYRQGVDIIQSWYGDAHQATGSALTMLGRSLIPQGRTDEADTVMREALAVLERVYGPTHPRVASAVNELGLIASRRGDLDEAEARFRRMVAIYRVIYNDKHYLIGIALSNLAGVLQQRKQFEQAEQLFRETLLRYAETLAPDHQLVGIAHIRLGRVLLAQRRFEEAAMETLAGYELLAHQVDPGMAWLTAAREDLIAAYEGLERPEAAERFRQELAALAADSASRSQAR